MRVILLEDVKGSGKKDQIVNVSDGYAKNCLFPKKLAKEANKQSIKELSDAKKSLKHKNEMKKLEAIKVKEIINEKTIKVLRKGGEDGKLFGAVTTKDISSEIKKVFDVEIDKHKIILGDTIKSFGSYKFDIKIFPEIIASMLVMVTEE